MKSMRLSKVFLILTVFYIQFTIKAQTIWTDQVYNPDAKGIENNPMKGLMPGYTGINSNFPYSTDHFYINLKSVFKNWGICDWTAFETEVNRIVQGGRHVIPRFYIDYPGKPNYMPDFLLDNIGYKVPMRDDNTPVWNDDTLIVALENFISLFGAKYDGDQRFLMIEAGLNGYWGEWHCYPERDWEMNQTNKDRIIKAYNAAFKKTHIALRHAGHPGTVALAKSLGYYDDSFCYQTICTGGDWCFTNSLIQRGITDNYKYHPVGGEIYPNTQKTMFDAWPNALTDATGNKIAEDITKCVNETHISFVKAFGAVFTKQPTPTQFTNALRMHKMMGYKFFVKSVKITPDDSNKFNVSVNIQNLGVAPIYQNWQVEFSAKNSSGIWTDVLGTADWNTNTIYPDTINYLKTFSGTLPSKDVYKILMRFKNPLSAFTSKAFPLRFANGKQDADMSGWLTLGTIDLNTIGTNLSYKTAHEDIRIFPNPVSASLNIESAKNTIKEVSLYSMSGKLLYSKKTDALKVQIDVEGLHIKDMVMVKVSSDKVVSMHKTVIM